MSKDTSGGFAKFLKNSANKLSSKKDVKFLPPQTTEKEGETQESKAKSQKEHRRAQVRKAQIEHRQRKQNHIKYLEQDVVRLRDLIAKVEIETSALAQENISIKNTLSMSNIAANTTPLATIQPPRPLDASAFESLEGFPSTNATFGSPQPSLWASNSSSSNVSITFDSFIDASCLQVNPGGSFDNVAAAKSPEAFDSSLTQQSGVAASRNEALLQAPLPKPSASSTSSSQPPADISTIAINFILALEHPCRTHFHARPLEFDPTGDPTGHELMASTLLYSHAPEHIFKDLGSATWAAPSLELANLWEMSQSLPKGDFEITPVQAWFALSQNYDAGRLLGNLDGLKKSLAKLVQCFAFGSVIDELKFWGVVKDVMGE